MAGKLLVPPRELFDPLRQDLKTESDAIAALRYLSTRQKLDRYLEHVKRFAAAWLVRLVLRKSANPTDARASIDTAVAQILEAVTHTGSLSTVSVPKGVYPLGLTADGNITPPEYPDRPAEPKPARHLVEFPPPAWEDQREEALLWGDRDPARWGDGPAPADDCRLMAERLAEWEMQVAEYLRRYARSRKAAEEIYRPHSLFEQGLPPNTLQDRILFRWDAKYIERTLRHDLMMRAEQLLLHDALIPNDGQQIPTTSKVASTSRKESIDRVKDRRPGQRQRANDRVRRSQEVHTECDGARHALNWSPHDWADKAKVSHSAIDRIMNGRTNRIRLSTRRALFDAIKKGLEDLKRLDLLMKSSRWTG
jgi:hypothetical protein